MRRSGPVYSIAFLSGACALVYEVVWVRSFIPVFGLSVYSTTTVLCAFMGGLGLGSVLAPRVLRAWSRSPWLLYALLEVGIGVGAIAVPLSIGPITSAYVAVSAIDPGALTALVRFLLSFGIMAIPTLFMGLTLPVIIHGFRELADEDRVSAKRIGLLYGLNTVGAALGCLLVGFVLIYRLGLWNTVLCTAAVNGLLACLVAVLYVLPARQASAAGGRAHPVAPRDRAAVVGPVPTGVPSVRWILLLYALVGFTSLGYELIWFRILIFYLQSATYSFTIMLTLFLLGVGLGSAFHSLVVERGLRGRTPEVTTTIVGAVQILIAITAVGGFLLFGELRELWAFLIDGLGADSWLMIELQKVILAAVIILPPTFLMGVSFPLVGRLYKAHGSEDSRTVGHLYAANTLGAIAGTVVTGFVLFNHLGVQTTLIALSVLSVVAGLGFAARVPIRRRLAVGALALVCGVLLVATPSRVLIADFERAVGEIVFYREYASDITFVSTDGVHRRLAFNDGRGTSSTHPVSNYCNRLMAYSAMAMRPEAKDVLVICMGVGNTASAFAQFPIDRLDIVDISPGPFEAAKYFETNLDVLDDPRVHAHVQDGRNFLLTTRRQYDIINVELPSLNTDGVVSLYTREFYEIARSRLKEGGVLSQWIDSLQAGKATSHVLINTMLEVFPESTVWGSVASWWVNGVKERGPVTIDYNEIEPLFSRPEVRADLARVDSSLPDVMARLMSSGDLLRETVRDAGSISDDHTVVDFLIPKLKTPYGLGGGVGYYQSHLQELFYDRWREDGTILEEDYYAFPFYDRDRSGEYTDRSLQEVAVNFPDDQMSRILDNNDRWDLRDFYRTDPASGEQVFTGGQAPPEE